MFNSLFGCFEMMLVCGVSIRKSNLHSVSTFSGWKTVYIFDRMGAASLSYNLNFPKRLLTRYGLRNLKS